MARGKYRKTYFSDQLRLMMKAKGSTQKDIAAKVGVSQASVSGWLNGSIPNSDKLSALAEYFGVRSDDLLNPRPGINYEAVVHSGMRIKEAAEYAEKFPDKDMGQIAFSYKIAESDADEYRKRAIAAEEKLANAKKRLKKLLDEI